MIIFYQKQCKCGRQLIYPISIDELDDDYFELLVEDFYKNELCKFCKKAGDGYGENKEKEN